MHAPARMLQPLKLHMVARSELSPPHVVHPADLQALSECLRHFYMREKDEYGIRQQLQAGATSGSQP
jgi:hypothetical protein